MNYLVRHVLALLATMASTSAIAQDADVTDWETARSSNTREAYEDYLTAHPAGRFSREALLAIVRQAGEPLIDTEARGTDIVPASGPNDGFIPALY